MSDSGREWPSERPISREALMKTIENLTVSNQELLTENNKLRGILAAGKGDCVYCGLPAADIAKCPHGFPGCARMDDIVNKHETAVEMENTNLRVDVLNLRDALKSLTDKLEANDGRKPEPAE